MPCQPSTFSGQFLGTGRISGEASRHPLEAFRGKLFCLCVQKFPAGSGERSWQVELWCAYFQWTACSEVFFFQLCCKVKNKFYILLLK